MIHYAVTWFVPFSQRGLRNHLSIFTNIKFLVAYYDIIYPHSQKRVDKKSPYMVNSVCFYKGKKGGQKVPLLDNSYVLFSRIVMGQLVFSLSPHEVELQHTWEKKLLPKITVRIFLIFIIIGNYILHTKILLSSVLEFTGNSTHYYKHFT